MNTSPVNPPKRSWNTYNESLKKRGSITLWFSEEAIANWKYCGPNRQGAPYHYSDLAIEVMLTLRLIYHLALRQTEGFVLSLREMLNLDIAIPDYSTLCRRQKNLSIKLPVRLNAEPLHVVVDSTGLKVYGEGEWKVRQHGFSKRRTWRKLHLSLDASTQQIVAVVLTANNVHDADAVSPMLDQVNRPISALGGDGSYDKRKVYEALALRKARALIPPQHNAKITQHGNCSQPPLARDENIRAIRKQGRKNWKCESGYHRRSLAETAMFRFKTIIESKLSSRELENQQVEATLGCAILNRMIHMQMPLTSNTAPCP